MSASAGIPTSRDPPHPTEEGRGAPRRARPRGSHQELVHGSSPAARARGGAAPLNRKTIHDGGKFVLQMVDTPCIPSLLTERRSSA